MYSDYIDLDDKSKGFSVFYTGGDYCSGYDMDRKVKFNFNCDKDVEFEVRSVGETTPCLYEFNIYAKTACNPYFRTSTSSTAVYK